MILCKPIKNAIVNSASEAEVSKKAVREYLRQQLSFVFEESADKFATLSINFRKSLFGDLYKNCISIEKIKERNLQLLRNEYRRMDMKHLLMEQKLNCIKAIELLALIDDAINR